MWSMFAENTEVIHLEIILAGRAWLPININDFQAAANMKVSSLFKWQTVAKRVNILGDMELNA